MSGNFKKVLIGKQVTLKKGRESIFREAIIKTESKQEKLQTIKLKKKKKDQKKRLILMVENEKKEEKPKVTIPSTKVINGSFFIRSCYASNYLEYFF